MIAACLAGCGGGSDRASTSEGAASTSTQARTAPPATVPATPPPSTPATTPTTPTAPREPAAGGTDTTPGGGGEEPARSELVFKASGAGVSPKQASVAPYISVKVTLESADGSAHTLVIGGKTLTAGGAGRSASVTLPGLPPGKAYKGRADGRASVRIASSSEPGP